MTTLGLIVIAAISDMLDGYFARRAHEVTHIGKWLDPIYGGSQALFIGQGWVHGVSGFAILLRTNFIPRSTMYIVEDPSNLPDPGTARLAGILRTLHQILGR